jgi:hypothetical protein
MYDLLGIFGHLRSLCHMSYIDLDLHANTDLKVQCFVWLVEQHQGHMFYGNLNRPRNTRFVGIVIRKHQYFARAALAAPLPADTRSTTGAGD